MRIVWTTALLTSMFSLVACGDDEPGGSAEAGVPLDGGATPDAPAGGDGAVTAPLTFWGNVAPILNTKCVKCHQEGGIGPFRLDDYAEAKKQASIIAVATKDGIMPPYLVTHDGTCGQFEDAETLTAAEKQTIWDWATGDKAEGTPLTLPRPSLPGIEGATTYQTPMLVPVAQGNALAEFDEYRCFPLDTGLDQDTFITAYDVLPGNPAIVHHLVAFLVDPAKMSPTGKTNAEVMAELDATDPDRIGWPCFGMAGEGVAVDAVPAVWAPGQGPVVYPGDVGVKLKKDHKIVVQMHYNLADEKLKGQSDSTTIRLRQAATVSRQAVFVLEDAFLDTLGNPQPDLLPPGQKAATYTWKKTGAEMGLGQLPFVDLIGVMPHMHERGVRKQMSITQPGGPKSCAAKVERWDFEWQKMYFYKGTPTPVTATTEIELSCEYDTSQDTSPVLPGWGTRNEMCIAILMFALPPGI